jgi:hypothetical protein
MRVLMGTNLMMGSRRRGGFSGVSRRVGEPNNGQRQTFG